MRHRLPLLGLLPALLLPACGTPPHFVDAGDPFGAYLTRQPPAIVRDLGEEIQGDVHLRRVVFHSRTAQTAQGPQDSEVFALIARPVKPGRYPGLLVLHGGGQSPEVAKAVGWAAQGYIVVVPDLPGIIEPKNAPHSTGPWKGPYGSAHVVAKPDLTACSIFDGALAAVQALYLLRSQPDVISNRIGVTGVSWGGYAATMVCGIAGRDVTAAFSVYGCGYYDLGSAWQDRLRQMPADEAALWLKYLDAGRRADRITAAYFIAAAANDPFFWPPAVNATLARVPGPSNQLFAPNASHWAPVPGGTKTWTGPSWLEMEVPYFAWHLKGEGQPLPAITATFTWTERIEALHEGQPLPVLAATGTGQPTGPRITTQFQVTSPTPLTSAQVWFATSEEAWEKRKWTAVDAVAQKDGWYEATLPAPTATPVAWFASVSDNRPVTVSSLVQTVR